MSQDATVSSNTVSGHFVVPGTCFNANALPARQRETAPARIARDPVLRNYYLGAALAEVPRLLGAVDRNPYRPTYGCMDRQFWHYRTSSFPSQMFQEGVLPLALLYAVKLPGNRWYGEPRVRELAVAGMRFAARSGHRDGSCDDYYPYERALGAAVFSLQAAARAYQLLELDDPELRDWLKRRARWLIHHDESGRLANHRALAVLGLLRVWQITETPEYRDAAVTHLRTLLDWQSDEGWFEEYGGADPGYQTVTIDCLAKIRRLTGETQLDEPLRKAVAFARMFLHPDDSYAGQYGSRGTHHFYPHGMELLAADDPDAADLADGFLRGLAVGKQAALGDDRMFVHRLANLIEAYIDWAPTRPAPSPQPETDSARYFPQARILVRRRRTTQTVISAARGGVFKHFAPGRSAVTDAGLIVEMADGRTAVSQMHDLDRHVGAVSDGDLHPVGGDSVGDHPQPKTFSISGPLHWTRFETATPIKQAVFHTGMSLFGRWCRTLVRRLLQRRLITGRRACPVRLTRTFEFLPERKAGGGPSLRVTDTIELTHPRIRVRRMSFGTDHESAYVAASGVYQEGVLALWTNLTAYVDQLNAKRRVTVVREF